MWNYDVPLMRNLVTLGHLRRQTEGPRQVGCCSPNTNQVQSVEWLVAPSLRATGCPNELTSSWWNDIQGLQSLNKTHRRSKKVRPALLVVRVEAHRHAHSRFEAAIDQNLRTLAVNTWRRAGKATLFFFSHVCFQADVDE